MSKPINRIDLFELDDAPTVMEVSQKRPRWGRQILQNAEKHEALHEAYLSIEKYKVIYVARGFSEKEGVDYDETFSPMARYTSIILIISIASPMGWKLHLMDGKTTFLKGIIKEELYIRQP